MGFKVQVGQEENMGELVTQDLPTWVKFKYKYPSINKDPSNYTWASSRAEPRQSPKQKMAA
jgi:hypothetical protein